MSLLEKVCALFAHHKISYAVVGGHAVSLHGAVRGTIDIDFVVAWNKKTLLLAEQALNEIGLISRLPISAADVFDFRDEYIENRNLIAWSFYNPSDLTEQIDIIINYDLEKRKIKRFEVGEVVVKVLNVDDLIEMKKAAGLDQDLSDVAALIKLKGT